MIFTLLKFLKPLAPYILAVVAVLFAYSWIYNKGKQDGISQAYETAITETKKIVAKMNFKCPEVKPCPPSIDYDKIKGRNITLNLHQHNTVEIDGDSLIVSKIKESFREVVKEAELVRCKNR
jgi:hypothetical protein